jgi:hypothetical protein
VSGYNRAVSGSVWEEVCVRVGEWGPVLLHPTQQLHQRPRRQLHGSSVCSIGGGAEGGRTVSGRVWGEVWEVYRRGVGRSVGAAAI